MKVTDEMVRTAIVHKYGVELVPDDRMKDKMRALLHSACHSLPKQEPFSDDTLNDLRQNDNGRLNFVTLREFREVARAVEKAHGIGV
jgi:hypothetical protein